MSEDRSSLRWRINSLWMFRDVGMFLSCHNNKPGIYICFNLEEICFKSGNSFGLCLVTTRAVFFRLRGIQGQWWKLVFCFCIWKLSSVTGIFSPTLPLFASSSRWIVAATKVFCDSAIRRKPDRLQRCQRTSTVTGCWRWNSSWICWAGGKKRRQHDSVMDVSPDVGSCQYSCQDLHSWWKEQPKTSSYWAVSHSIDIFLPCVYLPQLLFGHSQSPDSKWKTLLIFLSPHPTRSLSSTRSSWHDETGDIFLDLAEMVNVSRTNAKGYSSLHGNRCVN